MDVVLGEPRSDGFLVLERIRRDENLGRDKDVSPTPAQDQHPRQLTLSRCPEIGGLETGIVESRAHRGHLVSPMPDQPGVPCVSPGYGSVSGAALSVAPARSGSPAPLLTFFVFRCPSQGGEAVHAEPRLCAALGWCLRKAASVRPSVARSGQGSTPASVAVRKTGRVPPRAKWAHESNRK